MPARASFYTCTRQSGPAPALQTRCSDRSRLRRRARGALVQLASWLAGWVDNADWAVTGRIRIETRPTSHDSRVVLRSVPFNAEAPITVLNRGLITPNDSFYVRNHFDVPALDWKTWRLRVAGLVEAPITYTLRDLKRFPVHSLAVTMECAGNGRSSLRPPVEGEQWGLGAVSTAEWTGALLTDVLDRVHPANSARHALFRAADRGSSNRADEPHRYERSLSLAEIREYGALLAYEMNGDPLPPDHGYPVRLIVPGWYGVASVKWLTDIELVVEPLLGHFQTSRYVYETERRGRVAREPVTLQRVRALITEPVQSSVVPVGPLTVRGAAWSGSGLIARVNVSVDGGRWRPAELMGQSTRFEWRRWRIEARIRRSGNVRIRARATDEAGHTQPLRPVWNRLGYGNNAVHEVSLQADG